MSNVTKLVKENKQAVLFLVKFVVLYILLNSIYGIWIEYYNPRVDPITHLVSKHTKILLSLFHDNIQIVLSNVKPTTIVQYAGVTVINIFEGCNGINVMIVFVVFIVAYSGPLKAILKFILGGLIIIYIMNLIRVTLLFWVAHYFPNSLYFFHKYFFTGIIYMVVFSLWYVWINWVRRNESGAGAD